MAHVHVISNLTSSLPQRAAAHHRRKLTLSTLARKHGLDPRRQPVVCSRNGQWISQKQWRRVCAKRDDVVVFCVMPRSGGFRIAALLGILLAAAVVAPFLAAPLAAALPAAFGGAVTALTTAGLVIGGNYLLNVLLPVKPAGDLSQTNSTSPTYATSLSAQNNVARLGAAIPALYGRVRFVPDLASAPWVEWQSQNQILRQVFVLTQGEMDVEKIELGQSPLSSFTGITTQTYSPGQAVTLFYPEVFTNNQVTGIILTAPNDPNFGGISFKGPFVSAPPGRTCSQIGVDVSFPAGLYVLNQSTGNPDPTGIQFVFNCRQIDDNGDPIGSWTFLDAETADSTGGELVTTVWPQSHYMGGGYDYVAQRTSPITVSFRIDLPHSGRWEIRAFRNSDKNLNGTVGHDIAWVGLRGFLEPSRVYGQCTVLAMQIKNTANSSVNDQSAHQIVVTGTRKLPIYNGSTWSAPTATRSIAWAVADMLKNTTYGGKRSDTDFDLAELFALDAIWTARGDKFDYYAAQTTTLWAALGIALRAGRAVPYHQSGVVRFHRDAPQTVPTMLFSAENIVKGSFQMNFILPSPEDETDAIQVDYLSELDWLQESIILPKPGVISPQAPSQNKLDGVVQTTQAQNEAAYMLAADQYRRVLLSWDTELEGLIASRGDLVLVQHDMPRWGQSTRVYDWNPTTKTVTLWGRIEYDGGVWFAYFRDRQGRASTETYIDSYDDNDLTLRLPSAPVYPSGLPFDMTATRSEPLHVVVGKSVAVPRQAIFLGAVPRGGKTVSITAVLEDSRVHVN